MNRSTRTIALGLVMSAAFTTASALGFGRMPTGASLGQPLDLVIPVRLDAGETLSSECLAAQVSFADVPQQAGTVELSIDPAPPEQSDRRLRLRTTTRVDEPVVSIELSVGCESRMTRHFTVFADPPLMAERLAVQEAPPVVPIPATAEAERPAPQAETVRPAAPPPRKPRPAPRRKPPAVAAAPAPTPAAPAAPPAAEGSAAAAAEGARLQLAPLEAGAEAAPPPMAALAASAVAAEQSARAASEAYTAAQSRVEQLQSSVEQLSRDAASAQETVARLQTELARLQTERSGPGFTWLLLALVLLLLGAFLWMWRQRNQERQARAWLVQAAKSREGQSDTSILRHAASGFAPETLQESRGTADAEGGFRQTTASAMSLQPVRRWSASESGSLPVPAAAVEQRREVSVEELIDLEQQAEFFIVLGQDEAAIDLLTGHLRSSSGNSPLPYLKLLEIHKRRGERDAYERLRERFNSRFSAHAPDWDTDLQSGRTLDEYPSVMGRLQSLWPEPQRAMGVLEASLLRVEDDKGRPSHDSFDLPAYRELMMLYAVARDRNDEDDEPAVDLLLPLGDEDAPAVASERVFERLIATTSMEARPEAQPPLGIDLTLEDEPRPRFSTTDFDPTVPPPEPSDLPRRDG